MGQMYPHRLRWALSGLLAISCSLEDDEENDSTLKTAPDSLTANDGSGERPEDTSDSGNNASNIPIIIPEVYSAGQRIGYLLEFDHTSILKIWDDKNHRFLRINEKTGYLLGVPDHKYYLDNKCTIPLLMISPEPWTCGRGSEMGATIIFAEEGNLSGTIVGTRVLSYSGKMDYLQFFLFREHLDPPCYREFMPSSNKWFRGCMKTTTILDDGPLFFPLPIEIQTPSAPAADLNNSNGSAAESTLRVYSHGDYIGDFAGFRDEAIYVYQPSTQRLMGVNQVTGILSGGFGDHLFLDDQCAHNMARSSIWNKQSCPLTDEGFVPPRSEIWAHRGDPEGWKLGEHVLQSTGSIRTVTSLFRALWHLKGSCVSESSQCVQDAVELPEFPLNFPTPIEIRKEPWQ